MAISTPLIFPTHTGVRSIELRATNATAVSSSPFTYNSQALHWGGEMWSAGIELPPMRRSDAEIWVAWLVALRGRFNPFYLGDTSASSIRGTATTVTVTGDAGDSSLTAVSDGTLLAGDMIQIGTGSDGTLHKVLIDLSGSGTLEVWPAIRKDRTAEVVTLASAKGVFRLDSNDVSWSVNEACIYGISFGATEAL